MDRAWNGRENCQKQEQNSCWCTVSYQKNITAPCYTKVVFHDDDDVDVVVFVVFVVVVVAFF
jgi:hypothetical protein